MVSYQDLELVCLVSLWNPPKFLVLRETRPHPITVGYILLARGCYGNSELCPAITAGELYPSSPQLMPDFDR